MYWRTSSNASSSSTGACARSGISTRLHYVPVLSAASDAWDGRRGWVHEAALADLDPCAYDVYASGPPEMIAAVRRDFAARGVAAGRLWFDSFDYAPDALARQATSAATRS